MLLNLGCGTKPIPGMVNVDQCQLPGVDVVHDLNLFPYPWADGVFDKVHADDVLEHLADVIKAVQEIGRILKTGGTLYIRGPDGEIPAAVWDDLTHKRGFTSRTFDGFDPETWDGRQYGHYHGPIKFRMMDKMIDPHGRNRYYILQKR